MAQVNENFAKLPGNYLFAEVSRRTALFEEAHPETRVIRMSVGDVTLPLPLPVAQAMKAAVDELADIETFKGYGPKPGYAFLRQAIAKHDFQNRGIDISADEIYISDGAKSDCGGIVDLFSNGNVIAVCDPIYPVYVDSNVMAGRAGDYDPETGKWSKLVYLPTTPANDFMPALPDVPVDLIYLCSPSNPTGTVLDRAMLTNWVNYANEHGAIILFDAAYERFVVDEDAPRSIFEIPGAKNCAIEFRSFSKTAGFTSARCGFIVIPQGLERDGMNLGEMWVRRQNTKFNGASYVIQRGAEAVYLPESQAQIDVNMAYYHNNARLLMEALSSVGLTVYGGVNSPYVWCNVPEGMTSWEFFDQLLEGAGVVTTPGSGFGPAGEGFMRISAFARLEDVVEATQRITELLS